VTNIAKASKVLLIALDEIPDVCSSCFQLETGLLTGDENRFADILFPSDADKSC